MTAPPLDATNPTTAELDGRLLVTFGGCNYLGLAQHPGVTRAAAAAIARFGLSTSASRETTGNTRLHQALESDLADFCGHPAGLLVPDGYIANLAALQGLAASGVRDAVVDRRAHASLRDAALLAGMRVHPFLHRDSADAAVRIRACEGPAVVLTDSVFAADGAVAKAAELLGALREGDRLLLDDCHGFAVLGRNGRGLPDQLGLRDARLVVTTTLAKGLGCGGGIAMGDSALIDAARSASTAYICTTPASPAVVAGAAEALGVLRSDATLHARLFSNLERVRSVLSRTVGAGERTGVPIIAFTAGGPEDMRRVRDALLDAGVMVPLVTYPGGPAPVYFRLSVSACHTDEQIDLLDAALSAAIGLGLKANAPG